MQYLYQKHLKKNILSQGKNVLCRGHVCDMCKVIVERRWLQQKSLQMIACKHERFQMGWFLASIVV